MSRVWDVSCATGVSVSRAATEEEMAALAVLAAREPTPAPPDPVAEVRALRDALVKAEVITDDDIEREKRTPVPVDGERIR